MFLKNYLFLFIISLCSCTTAQTNKEINLPTPKAQKPLTTITGAQQIQLWLPQIRGKKIALVGNQTSIVFNHKQQIVHLVDTLVSSGIKLKKVFAPEHGFRGKADAGEHVKNGIDTKTGLPIISLYGKNKKPFPSQLEGIDTIIFDIQDVGVRFYTYISTLHYIMEACAEHNIPLLVLDRPNPNAHYIDGPVLNIEHKSFVGLHPVPIVYGMTIAEYAKMINGEKWLNHGIQCELNIVPLENYNHQKQYSLPVKPSPNLPNDTSINLYPSLCLFEGTKQVSVGRGTDMQFQIYGAPFIKSKFSFIPKANDGAKHPKNENKICFGTDLRKTSRISKLRLDWLINTYAQCPQKDTFFNSFFTKLIGTKTIQKSIENETPIIDIEKSWKKDLDNFKKIRKNYLIYR